MLCVCLHDLPSVVVWTRLQLRPKYACSLLVREARTGSSLAAVGHTLSYSIRPDRSRMQAPSADVAGLGCGDSGVFAGKHAHWQGAGHQDKQCNR